MQTKGIVRGSFALGVFTALCLSWPPQAPAQGFRRLATQDGVDVWAVGDAGAVYRSMDGGTIWSTYPMGSADHRDVAALGSRVWIVDADGTVWRSTDAGYTFGSQTPVGTAGLYGVSFIDAALGFAAGASGTVIKTTDGGASWTPLTTGTSATLHAIRFRDATEGWACGSSGTVLHTTDGGSTWAVTAPFAFTRDLYDLDFDGPMVFVTGTYGFCGKSTNAGASWSPIDLEIASKSDVNGVAVVPGGAVWLCGGGGFLRRTTDGGASFFFPKHPVISGLGDVHFSDESHGWACARNSKIVASTVDGGVTWTVPGGGAFTYAWSLKQSSGSATIRGNTFAPDPYNRDILYCVQGKSVFKSWNRGDSWTQVATIAGAGTRTNAFVVSPTDTLAWLALVQDGDRVTRTTDGGVTWLPTISIPYTEYGLPLDQDPRDGNTVYFGPEDGRIWKSTDFGATWFQHSNPGFRSPDDIAVVPDSTTIMYVADGVTGSGNGQVWKSSDGGLTWISKRTVPGSEVPMLAVSRHDPTIAYATDWSFGGVQRTTDTGETWPDVTLTASAWGADIAKDDPYVAMFAVYSGGRSYLSTDNGVTFQEASVSGANYGSLMYDRGTYFLHQSNGIYKSIVTQPDMPVNNAQSLTLLQPNGGEAYQYADIDTILWAMFNVPTIRVEYQISGGSWQLIEPAAYGPGGTQLWSIPNEPTTNAKVRVSDANDGAPLDTSDLPFSIVVPNIAANPTALDFGEVAIGFSRSDTIRIRNEGTAMLVIGSVRALGTTVFTPSRTSFSIAPGTSDTIAVVFEPIAEQAYADTLEIDSNAPIGSIFIPLSGSGGSPVGIAARLPLRFELRDNAPNPFTGEGTVISYSLPVESDVSLVVYNALGQAVATLIHERQAPGIYAVRYPGSALTLSRGLHSTLASGVYFYRLRAGDFVATKQMVYIR